MSSEPRQLWPTVNISESGHPVVVDSFIMVFFLEPAACRDPRPVISALEAFIRGPARGKLHFFIDENGDQPPIPSNPVSLLDEHIDRPTRAGALAELTMQETDGWGCRTAAKYHFDPEDSPRWPDKRAYLWFRLDQDRVIEDGLAQMVTFIQRLTKELPYTYGYASPALAYDGRIRKTHEMIHRHPGFDIAHVGICSIDIDTRPLGAYWLNVFSKPIVDKLGGSAQLASSDHEFIVLPAGQGGTMLMLDTTPDVGDVNRGNDLPLYRKLARILEPLMKVPEIVYLTDADDQPSPELQQAWHRRFLTPPSTP